MNGYSSPSSVGGNVPPRVLSFMSTLDKPPVTAGQKRILLVEDEPAIRDILTVCLSDDYDVVSACDGQQALSLLDRASVDLVVLDMKLPVLDGSGVLKAMQQRGDEQPVIVISGDHDFAGIKGAAACLRKPFALEKLERAVDRALSGS